MKICSNPRSKQPHVHTKPCIIQYLHNTSLIFICQTRDENTHLKLFSSPSLLKRFPDTVNPWVLMQDHTAPRIQSNHIFIPHLKARHVQTYSSCHLPIPLPIPHPSKQYSIYYPLPNRILLSFRKFVFPRQCCYSQLFSHYSCLFRNI